MEALECLDEQNGQSVDFYRFVRNVQYNVERTLLSKRNRQLRRQKMKQNWLVRSKIIPPSFKKLGKQEPTSFEPEHSIFNLASFDDYQKMASISETEQNSKPISRTSSPSKPQMDRVQCKTSHAILRSVNSCDRVRSNWKLQFRRDQLNVLKFRRQEETFTQTQIPPSPKAMRVRKIPKKFEQLRIQTYQLYKTNLQSSQKEKTCSSKLRYRPLNCSHQ